MSEKIIVLLGTIENVQQEIHMNESAQKAFYLYKLGFSHEYIEALEKYERMQENKKIEVPNYEALTIEAKDVTNIHFDFIP